MNRDDLSPAEGRVHDAFCQGEVTDFRTGDERGGELSLHAAGGGGWGPERTVRARVLRALLLGASRVDGQVAALAVVGARITGVLDLTQAQVEPAVRLMGCHFDRPVVMYAARLRGLNLRDSYLPGLDAPELSVEGRLMLSGCQIPGAVRLGGATVSSTLFLDGAQVGTSDGDLDDDEEVLHLGYCSIGSDLYAPELIAHGKTVLDSATIGRKVNLERARLHGPPPSDPSGSPTALDATNLTVGSDFSAVALTAHGALGLRGATIPGRFSLVTTRLSNPGGLALWATSCDVGELHLRDAEPIQGMVNLRRSRFGVIYAEPQVWPDQVGLDRLTYQTLLPHLPAHQRLPVLVRDDQGFIPQAYEQLAASYRATGDDIAARTVQLAKHRHHRATLPWWVRTWGYLQDATVGYGFRPWRAAAWLIALLTIGAALFTTHHPPPLKRGETPQFNPVIYTLDLLLPIIDLGQEKAFRPESGFQWLAFALTVLGWVLATTVTAGITRAVSRQ